MAQRHRSFVRPLAGALLFLSLGACAGPTEAPSADASLYALVQGIDGVYFYPPLGPEPSPAGTADLSLLDGISVTIEAEDSAGVTTLGSFDASTQPPVALLAAQERYWVNIPAAAYVTDPAKTYRIRVLLDGSELATSVLSAHVFDVLAWNPALPIGVHVRVEGSGAVRAIPRARATAHGTPRHCTDGVRNKDETGVDCGGSCAPCPTCTDGIQNQGELGVDCGGPCPVDLPASVPPAVTVFGGNVACPSGAVSAPDYWTNSTIPFSPTGGQMHWPSPDAACFGAGIWSASAYTTGACQSAPYPCSGSARNYCCMVVRSYNGGSTTCGTLPIFGVNTRCTTCPAGTIRLDDTPTCACPAGMGWDSTRQICRNTCGR